MKFVVSVVLSLALALMTASPSFAQQRTSRDHIFSAYAGGFQVLTVGIAATRIPLSVIQASGRRAQHARCSVEGFAIRYRIDGTDPTGTVGHVVAVGVDFDVFGFTNIDALRLIRISTATGDATVTCTALR